LLEGSLNEPIVFTRATGGERACLANVCTHRANLVVNEPCRATSLRCRYHGRRFGLDGRFMSMPEFEAALDFPTARDDLARVPHGVWGPLTFAGVAPAMSFDEWLGPFRERLSFVPWAALAQSEPERHYDVDAHWALYCDNYLEGFHVPFVHAGLNRSSTTALRDQLHGAISDRPRRTRGRLRSPADHSDHGKLVAAYTRSSSPPRW
jgi:choline monooxygenase